MRTGRRLHPPDDEPYRRGVRLGLERGVGGLGHIGGAVHPVRHRRPGIFGYRLDEIPQAGALADGDGEADIHPAADGDHGVGIEAAVGPHRELALAFAVAHPPIVSRRKWAALRPNIRVIGAEKHFVLEPGVYFTNQGFGDVTGRHPDRSR